MTFPLAPMSPLIAAITIGCLALPAGLLVLSVIWSLLFLVPAAFVAAIYAWIWLRYRPTEFVVHPTVVEVAWPLRRREIPRGDIVTARVIDQPTLRREAGWGMRVGAGGLFGGFGYLWTTKRGLVRMYVSRTDRFVWIECRSDRPWLITPDRPDAFVRALSLHA